MAFQALAAHEAIFHVMGLDRGTPRTHALVMSEEYNHRIIIAIRNSSHWFAEYVQEHEQGQYPDAEVHVAPGCAVDRITHTVTDSDGRHEEVEDCTERFRLMRDDLRRLVESLDPEL